MGPLHRRHSLLSVRRRAPDPNELHASRLSPLISSRALIIDLDPASLSRSTALGVIGSHALKGQRTAYNYNHEDASLASAGGGLL
jgi:hypothetical protein